jgi:hypothetical protein
MVIIIKSVLLYLQYFLLDGQETTIDIKEPFTFYQNSFYIKSDDYPKYDMQYKTELGKVGLGPYKPGSDTPFDFRKTFGGRKGEKLKAEK